MWMSSRVDVTHGVAAEERFEEECEQLVLPVAHDEPVELRVRVALFGGRRPPVARECRKGRRARARVQRAQHRVRL